VTDAVQTLRQQARHAGNLNGNEQEKVSTQGSTIVIEPANPDVVYVPAYDPWAGLWRADRRLPRLVSRARIYWGGVGLSFGIGFGIGFFGGFGWGWGHWGYDWHGRRAFFDHHAFVSHSHEFGHEDSIMAISATVAAHGGGFHGSSSFHGGSGFHGGSSFTRSRERASGAFSGFDHGGNVRGFSSRGRSSFGGASHGGGFHGGGGGRHR